MPWIGRLADPKRIVLVGSQPSALLAPPMELVRCCYHLTRWIYHRDSGVEGQLQHVLEQGVYAYGAPRLQWEVTRLLQLLWVHC